MQRNVIFPCERGLERHRLKLMRLAAVHVAISLLFCGSISQAGTVEVPLLPDGTVDLEKVYPTFSATSPILTSGNAPVFEGELLGQSYYAEYEDAELTEPFSLTVRAEDLSQHGHYFIAVSLIDIICLRSNLRPDEVLWRDTSERLSKGWRVQVSCSKESRQSANQ